MSHMDYGSGDGVSCGATCGGPRIVEYTADGTELPGGFVVPIDTTLAAADYHVTFFGVEADIITPVSWSFPASEQTTSQFEARFAGEGLTAGGVYKFQIVEA